MTEQQTWLGRLTGRLGAPGSHQVAQSAPADLVKLLFFSKTALLRHFDSTLVDIARSGHELVLATGNADARAKVPAALLEYPNVTPISYKRKRADGLQGFLSASRRARDFVRYLDPQLEVAWANRDRAWRKLVVAIAGSARADDEIPPSPWIDLLPEERARLNELFSQLEELVPSDPGLEEYIRSHDPDAVLVTPLITIGSRQTDVVKACRALGLPCGLPVFSWDNLSNKGTMHACPDRVFVWNEVQAREAVDLHGVPRNQVVITGAPRFDEFFALRPSTTRQRFLKRFGLDPSRPAILYLGSSPFVSSDEPKLVDRLIEAVRSTSDPLAQEAGILVRPHPRTKGAWEEWSPSRWDNVALGDTSIYSPQSLFDQISACDVIVGLNTSAQIEAAILGKPVYTIDVGAAAPGQDGSSHFYYLLRENDGFVERATSMEEHLAQLSRGLAGDFDRDRIRRFVEMFVRPHGLDQPAAPILASAFLDLAQASRTVKRRPSSAPTNGTAAHEALETSGGDLVLVDYPKQPIRIRASSPAERKWRAHACRKEPWTVAWLEEHVRPRDVVYDVGANVGVFSLIAATLLRDSGTVVAFEPGFSSYARLCENVELNGLMSLVVPVPLALSQRSGLQPFTYRSLEPGQSRHRHDQTVWQPGTSGNGTRYTQPMLAIRLDEAVQTFQLPPPNLVKIDVDGAERSVIAGAHSVLSASTVRSLLIEIDRSQWDETLAALRPLGLELRRRHGADDARVWYAELGR